MESSAKLVNATRQKDALTDNQAVTHSTSLNSVVDLFFIAGASRAMNEESIISMLERAWVEDAQLTLKTIFWAGDIRGGAGERRFFRIALKWLENNHFDDLIKNLYHVPEYNRWDSLFHLETQEALELIRKALDEGNGLCAKWMPRKKQHNNFADKFRRYVNADAKTYRKNIVELSKTVEQQMCAKEWSKIKYEQVPSVAMNKYRKAFSRNDESRFVRYIESVNKGETKINAGAIFPHDIYRSLRTGGDEKSINAQWNALPDYLADSNERMIPVCDVSGSMCGLPIEISVSLGIYLSERNKSVFKDAFITFSGNPKMEYLKGDFVSRCRQLSRAHWDMNTDLNKVFELILSKAIDNDLSQEDMPTTILIISDMEFDYCGRLTNYEKIVQNYEDAGYEIPKIVFWNVNGREGNVPVNAKKKNVGLVSGCSPAIVKSVLTGDTFTPESIMKKVLLSERYEPIKLSS